MLVYSGTTIEPLYMAKDKLITLLIEEAKRERLKQHCSNLGLNVSQVLSKCIDDILSGSINPLANSSTSIAPLDIDIESTVNEVIDYHPINKMIEYQDITIERLCTETDYLKTCLQICEDRIDNLTKLINTREVLKPLQAIYSHQLTLEDTKQFLITTYKDNLSSKPSERTSQQNIAELLTTGNYPHPNDKKWNRDEVRDVCKLWEIKTK